MTRRSSDQTLRIALVGALLLGIGGRLIYGFGAPLWFDETFSGVIATQPAFAKLLDWCLNELTGPAYYMPLWAWVRLAGPSDIALRLPSLLLSVSAPLLILWRVRDRETREYWAILCLLWAPAFAASWDARGYAQLFLLGTAQAIVFLRLLRSPSRTAATLWMLTSALLILTHYWSAIGCLVQGSAFLIFHRRRALACWQAALVLLPVAGWAGFHLPAVFALSDGGAVSAVYAMTVLADIPETLFGVPLLALVVGGALVWSCYAARRGRFGLTWTPAHVLALCGIVTVAAVILLACARPGFASRYMTPAMPSFLFGVATWLRWASRRDGRIVGVVLAVWFVTAGGVLVSGVLHPERDARHVFELERPSAWLTQGQPRRLIFFWDGPVAARSSGAHLAEVGGFFFRRAGRAIPVEVAPVETRQDPNGAITKLAAGDTGAAILWIANDQLPVSRAPRLGKPFDCRDFGRGQVTLTACRGR